MSCLRRAVCLLLALSILALLPGCGSEPGVYAKGDFCHGYRHVLPHLRQGGGDAADTCTAIIQQLERELSATDPASDLAQLNAAGEGALPEDAAQLLADTLALSHRTGGALDPTVYPLVCLWGFPAQAYRVPTGTRRSRWPWRWVGPQHVRQSGMQVQLG